MNWQNNLKKGPNLLKFNKWFLNKSMAKIKETNKIFLSSKSLEECETSHPLTSKAYSKSPSENA